MPRVKHYLDIDVLTAARQRIQHIFDIFDSVVVMFSGGKDSLTCLHLVWEEAQRQGRSHVDVVFRDEELIPDSVIDFVNEYRQKSWVRMRWYAVPLRSYKYILGVTKSYIQWDPGRRWIRHKPEWAITLDEDEEQVFDQHSMDAFIGQEFMGKIAFVTGIRASESIMRLKGVLNKLNEPYICSPPRYSNKTRRVKNIKLCKPIYDWSENDVFKYFGENNIPYCPIYDYQLWSGAGLRVSTPLHAESAKRFGALRRFAPTLYAQVIDLFPEMLVQERYYAEYDLKKIRKEYGKSFDTVISWIQTNLEGQEKKLALLRVSQCQKRYQHSPKAYPPDWVFKEIMRGGFKRQIMPLARKDQK